MLPMGDPMLTRRRFIAISAVAAALPAAVRAGGESHLWTGQALGARAAIRLDHPQAQAIAARAAAEIARLEGILSLYRADSALSRLNRDGHLAAPPFELLDCLTLAGLVHAASAGLFDPTVQPLWALWAEAAAGEREVGGREVGGREPAPHQIREAMARAGWPRLRVTSAALTLPPGGALTLNGIGQGYVADRIAALLAAEGLTDILIDTGEFRALGGRPGGGDWPVRLAAGGAVDLRERALATSAPLGTTFDAGGRLGHILDPRTGRPARPVWQAVTISAPSAAIADALTTAACLMDDAEAIAELVARFPGARLEALRPA